MNCIFTDVSDGVDVVSDKEVHRDTPPTIPPPPTPVLYNYQTSFPPRSPSEVEHIYETIDHIHDPAYSYAWTDSPATLLNSKNDIRLGISSAPTNFSSEKFEEVDKDAIRQQSHRATSQYSSSDLLTSQYRRESLSLDDLSISKISDAEFVESYIYSQSPGNLSNDLNFFLIIKSKLDIIVQV